MAESDVSPRERIIKHMNDDHQDSLVRFLKHFNKIPSATANTAQLTDITFEHMIVSYTGRRNILFFDPPLQHWREARTRVVKMDEEARAGLGQSDIAVTRYIPPKGFGATSFIVCLVTFSVFSTRSNFMFGSLLYESLLRHVPSFNHFCWNVQPYVLALMVAIHSSEVVWMASTRLYKHHVPFLSPLWFLWVASTFIEGAPAFFRIDALIRGEKAEKSP